MFVQRVLKLVPLNGGDPVPAGVIGFRFNAAGAAAFNIGKVGTNGLEANQAITLTALAGEFLETGPVFSTTTLPAGTLGVVLR